MGLAASQCRFAMLTSRQNDVESKMMHIANEKLSLSRQSAEASEKYSNALNKTNLVWGTTSGDAVVDYNMFNHSGSDYLLTNSSGAVILTPEDAKNYGIDSTTGKLPGKESFLTKVVSGVTPEQVTAYLANTAAVTPTTPASNDPTFTTNYKYDDVFAAMAEATAASSGSGAGFGSGAGGTGAIRSAANSTTGNIACFFQSSDNNGKPEIGSAGQAGTAAGNLHSLVTSVCTLAGTKVTEILKKNCKDGDWSAMSSYIQDASKKALAATIDWYNAQIVDANKIIEIEAGEGYESEYVGWGGSKDSLEAPAKMLSSSISVGCEAKGQDEFYVDITEMTKYYLMKFDEYCEAYDGDTSDDADDAVKTTNSTTKFCSLSKYSDEHYGGSESATAVVLISRTKEGTGDSTGLVTSGAVQKVADDTGLTTSQISDLATYSAMYDEMEDNSVVISNDVKSQGYLEQQILNGNILVKDLSGTVQKVGEASSPMKSVAADTTEAKAEYESDKDKIDYKESMLDVEQTNLDSERLAITTEKESVQKLLDSNVKAFKMFEA